MQSALTACIGCDGTAARALHCSGMMLCVRSSSCATVEFEMRAWGGGGGAPLRRAAGEGYYCRCFQLFHLHKMKGSSDSPSLLFSAVQADAALVSSPPVYIMPECRPLHALPLDLQVAISTSTPVVTL